MRGNIEQAWINRRKTIIAAIRLRHSIAADNEINATLEEAQKAFNKEVMKGTLPAPLDPKRVIGG